MPDITLSGAKELNTRMKHGEWIGWLSSLVLLLTIGRQVYTQWKTRASAGVSKWLFIGQTAASMGFVVYSYLLRNWVFLVSNLALLATALIGEALFLHNRNSSSGLKHREGKSSAR